MTYQEFKAKMDEARRDIDHAALALKDSGVALEKLSALYRRFDADERAMADRVLSEWVLSTDEGERFDAVALIDEFHIVVARETLLELSNMLAASRAPGAPFERRKVLRVVDGLQ